MPAYEQWFTDLAYYRLPDGTEAQAIWSTGGTRPPSWILVPLDNPAEPAAWHSQYEVLRSGAINIVRYAGEQPIAALGDLPEVEFSRAGYSDLRVDDFTPSA